MLPAQKQRISLYPLMVANHHISGTQFSHKIRILSILYLFNSLTNHAVTHFNNHSPFSHAYPLIIFSIAVH